MRFMGTYRPKLDEKGRLFLPAKFRNALAEGVVVTQGQENCLFVWPPEVFDREADKAMSVPLSSASGRSHARIFFSGGDEMIPDKQGRISINPALRAYARLDRDVVVIGVRDRLEIWNPPSWETYQAEQLQTFAELDEALAPS